MAKHPSAHRPRVLSRGRTGAPRARARTSTICTLTVALALLGGCEGILTPPPSGPRGTTRTPPTQQPLVPAPPMLHRLTRAEYEQTLRDLLPAGTTVPAELPNDTLLHGFTTVGASELTIPPLEVEQYEAASNDLALQIIADPTRRAEVFGCDVAADGDACIRAFLVTFGQRAWRRPLAPAEIDSLASLGADLTTLLRDPWRAAGFVLSALLQSPHFLFRVEVGEPDPADRARLRFTSWEMASRLSYFLWGTMPDAELLRAAGAGELVTEEGVRAQVDRMLGAAGAGADARSSGAMSRFWYEFMQLDRLESVSKDPATFPMFTEALRDSMRVEVESIFEDVYTSDADIRTVFSTDVTFVDTALAAHYGLPDPGEGVRARTTLPAAAGRGGVMGRAAVLSMWAHATLTSPTYRGKFIRTNLLCTDISPPPAGITTELPEPTGEPQTLRMRLEQHRTDPVCAACHDLMDPLGYTLEHFDPVGQWRDLDEGLPIDASAELDGTAVDGAADLGEFLASSERVGACFARRFYRWSSAHLETRGELPELARIEERFAASGYRVRELVRIVALSDAFRFASYPIGDCALGDTRDCSNACGAGTQTCEGGTSGGAWTACSAPTGGAESCNGTDDDCDGSVDEGVSRACTSACGSGIESCVAGAFAACTARTPAAEICSHADEDCDGTIDEGFGALAFAGSYTALRTHHPLCDGGAQRIGLECNMAIHGLCSTDAATCGTSGFGPVENSGDAAHLACVTADVRVTSYAELAAHHGGCDGAGERVGQQCNAAIHRSCMAAGYPSGFGPVQVSGTAVSISCVPGAEVISTTYTEMSAHHGGCTGASRIGPDCNAAIHRFCASRGAVSGFGPLENSGDGLQVACVRP